MATVTSPKKLLSDHLPFSNVPYGNRVGLSAALVATAAGILAGSNQATAVQVGDKIRFAVLPAGMQLVDALAIVSDAATAATTIDIGFEYVDGVDSATVPQDADYFFNDLSTAAAGRTRANNTGVRPVTLPKDAYLIGTVAGAAWDQACAIDVFVDGIVVGQP